jgi:pyruvate dehydrogenase E1 component beta subunit
MRPLDWDTVAASVRKTGRLLALDSGLPICSVASEIVAFTSEHHFAALKAAPRRLTMPDHPEPTSFALTRNLHPSAEAIANVICETLALPHRFSADPNTGPHDVPGPWFKGPF